MASSFDYDLRNKLYSNDIDKYTFIINLIMQIISFIRLKTLFLLYNLMF